jgi:hypothetical protein
VARGFVEKARQYDPSYAPRENVDRDAAVGYYEQAIRAQPGAKLNGKLADRIAQLHAFYVDKERGIFPDPQKAAEWWTTCLTFTTPDQLLWAEAKMGLASAGIASRNFESAASAYAEILSLNTNQLRVDDWREWPSNNSPIGRATYEHELNRIKKELTELKARVVAKIGHADARLLAQRNPELRRRRISIGQTDWTMTRRLAVAANIALVLLLVGLVIRRYRKKITVSQQITVAGKGGVR